MWETILMGVFAIFMICMVMRLKEKRAKNPKFQKILEDFRAQVDAMLEEDEVVEAICGYVPCAAVTDRRLLVSSKKGVVTVPFDSIQKIQGLDVRGDKTSDAGDMLVLEIKAQKRYNIANHSEGFEEVVEALKCRVKFQ